MFQAYFVERRPLGEIAQRFGYCYTALRDLIDNFRAQWREDQIPPFSCHLAPGGCAATAVIPRPSARSHPPSLIASG